MPRVLRSPQAKLSEIGNVSVPDADGAREIGSTPCRGLKFLARFERAILYRRRAVDGSSVVNP